MARGRQQICLTLSQDTLGALIALEKHTGLPRSRIVDMAVKKELAACNHKEDNAYILCRQTGCYNPYVYLDGTCEVHHG